MDVAPFEQARRLFFDTLVYDAAALRYLTELFGDMQLMIGPLPFLFLEGQTMRFARYSINGTRSWGFIDGEDILDLANLAQDLKSAIAGGLLGSVADRRKAPRAFHSPISLGCL